MKNKDFQHVSNRAPWHIWLIGLFFIFIYTNGIYDYFMMLGHNEEYYSAKNYGADVHDYFSDYPLPFLILWTVNVFTGFIAPILLLIRKRIAVSFALISAFSNLFLVLLTFTFRDRWNVLGPWISLFDIGIVIITFGLFFYCKNLKRQNVLN